MKKLLKLSLLPMSLMLSAGTLAQTTCPAAVTVADSWGAGARYAVSITNGSTPLTSWQICFSLSGTESIDNIWNANKTASSGNICISNMAYNGSIAANASLNDVGFQVLSPSGQGAKVTSFNGVACGTGTPVSSSSSSTPSSAPVVSSSSSVPSSAPVVSSSSSSAPVVSSSSSVATVPSSSSSSSTSSAPAVANGSSWVIDTTKSTFYFVPVKNTNTAEAMTFTEFSGTVSASGNATFRVPLTTISSGVSIRNTRMRNFLWESDFFPHLYFTTQLDLTAIDALAVGSVSVQEVTGSLNLHGIAKTITFNATIVKHSNNSVSFSPRRPIVMNSADFELNAGVERLRKEASQTAIGERAPVFFKMFLSRDGASSVAAITVPTAPAAPSDLLGSVSAVTGDVDLYWTDASNNETGFAVRRKGVDGRWTTASNTLGDITSFTESLLLLSGVYDYKVMAFNQGIASAASNLVNIEYYNPDAVSSTSSSVVSSVASSAASSTGNPGEIVGDVARGQSLWTEKGCIGCHGVDGERNANGTFAYVSVNPNREIYRHSQDTEARTLREFITRWMPQDNPGSCVGQCAADLEALIRSWRRPSDGIPDKPVAVFSCPSDASTYGQRTLRLLTKQEYQRSVRDLVQYTEDVTTRLPDDFIAGYFTNNNTLLVDRSRYTIYLASADRIAESVATRWSSVLGCSPSSSCATTLVDTLGKRIFRRPLTTTERTEYLAIAQGTAAGRTVAEGMQIALSAMLSSPQFLYRSEIGEAYSGGVYKLTPYELAAYISYTFSGTTPTAALMTAAENGSLNTEQGIRAQVATLLNSAAANELMVDLINRWLGTEQLQIKEKDGFANFADIAQDMKKELGKNFADAMLNSQSTFSTLYTPSYTHVNQRLASLYGLSFSGTPDADGFVKAVTQNYGGILTTGAFMSRYATASDANMITRAVALRRRMMCQDIPEPPSGVSLDREALFARDAEFFSNPATTQRMMYDRITSGTTCSNCHGEIINQVGGGMENFDAMGRVRAVDLKGNPINAVGTFFSPFPQLQFLNDPDRVIHSPAITFDGAQDLASTIVSHPLVSNLAQSCLATQMVSYSSGIHHIFLVDTDRDVGYARISKAEEDAYRCGISDLTNTLATQGPRAMLERIPTLNSVIYRQEWAR